MEAPGSFNLAVQVLSVGTRVPTQEQLDAGAAPLVTTDLIVGVPLPFAQNGQPIIIPLGTISFELAKGDIEEICARQLEAVKDLPEPKTTPDIQIANSLSGVDQAAEAIKRFQA